MLLSMQEPRCEELTYVATDLKKLLTRAEVKLHNFFWYTCKDSYLLYILLFNNFVADLRQHFFRFITIGN